MKLGAFSISLHVKDIQQSLQFYQKLGFSLLGGNIEQNWVILKNGATVIGLFQGRLQENVLTFNPGWDQNAQNTENFTDVRDIQRHLKSQGIEFVREADTETTGPEHFIIKDPDGNVIMLDQHR
ncbi:VOC family protein [Chryseobacterium sp. MFBS3-17]|uniref:VOC family protein n=1 Tax=Chryseobacterium sp. MFBS3-17 TaxID=2886689 RepID=UPI001D0F49C0|nr:VOC family protein [Chryseobacterium sp. MFBS3-17]MCC2589931.1 VOC family protein [Chryseobacterium sp. MFBS3-17]